MHHSPPPPITLNNLKPNPILILPQIPTPSPSLPPVSHNKNMRIVTLLTLLAVTYGGFITPKTPWPIRPAFNNVGILCDYQFYYQIETYMPASSTLQIIFPSTNFETGLGIQSTCQAETGDGDSLTCSVSGLVVTVNLGETSNLPSDNTNVLILKGIKNPITVGGTGQFRLESFTGITSLDNNDMFGSLGFIPAPDTLGSGSVACESNCKTGELGNYSVSLSHTVKIDKKRDYCH